MSDEDEKKVDLAKDIINELARFDAWLCSIPHGQYETYVPHKEDRAIDLMNGVLFGKIRQIVEVALLEEVATMTPIVEQAQVALGEYEKVRKSGLGTGYTMDVLAEALKRLMDAVEHGMKEDGDVEH